VRDTFVWQCGKSRASICQYVPMLRPLVLQVGVVWKSICRWRC